MNDDDPYVRHQMLAALVSVLLHDLRNPLHSSTLLIEAMGSRTADIEGLRAKLRAQLSKLDGLISEAAGPIKELTLDACVEKVAVDALVRAIGESFRKSGGEARLVLPPASTLTVSVDPKLLVRAAVEVATTVAEKQDGQDGGAPPTVVVTVGEAD